jgi:two-component system, cell cycle sensor histidine kinase and response regulator CckA
VIPGTPRRYQFEWLLLGVVLLILGALIGDWLYAEHAQIESLERDRLQVQARVIDENLGRQLEGVNYALASIRDDLLRWNGETMSVAPSNRLTVLSDAMPGVRTLLIANSEGTVLDSNQNQLIGRNFSEREYFKAPREHPDPAMLYVSPPFKTVFGVVVIAVTRAVIGPGGEFAGVVCATLDPDYFDVLLRSVLYAPDMRAVLVHGDGRAFVAMPPTARVVGVDLAKPGSFFSRHRESGQIATLLTGTSTILGGERMMASRTFRRAGAPMDRPLVIHVSRELSAVYLPWRKQALVYGVFYALIAITAILGLHLLQRRRRSFDLAAAEQDKADRLLRHFFELPFVGLAITSPGTKRWLQVNDRLCQTLGYSREELTRMTWAELTHPEDLGKDVAEFERVLRGESEGYSMDKRFVCKDGAVVFTVVDIKCTRNADGTVAYIVAMVQDISERKRAQEALLQSEQRLRAIVETEPECVKVVGRDGQVLEMNAAGLAMLEAESIDEVRRHTLIGFLLPQYRAAFGALHERVMRGESGMLEFEIVGLKGTRRWLETHAAPMHDAEGEVAMLLGITREITERKNAEQTHVFMEAQLRESQKMEALGTLAGGVAHDFNNIVAAILGNVELARQDVGPGHAALKSLEEILKAGRRAKDLVQQILAFGRRQVLERRVISLAPVVEESARLLRTTLPAAVSLSVNCAPDAPAVIGDATQIEQVLLNLCANAWQAMQGQTRPATIAVSLMLHVANRASYKRPERRTQGGRVALRPGRYACLTVRDNGPGMDQETRSRIFEPFFTTKPAGEGTGLGLAVVHGITQDHGASIAVQTAPGEGAVFRIYFPAVEAPADSAREAGAEPAPRHLRAEDGEAPIRQGQGKSMLYLDDDESIVFLMTRLLERQGYRVSGYTDPQEALTAVRAEPNRFDLAVTDYNMPGMSGLDVACALREIRADLPVAIASGYITEELRAQAPAAGVIELLYKPDTVDELCEVVARLANTRRGKENSS